MKDEIQLVLLDYKRRCDSGDISPNTLKTASNAYENLLIYWAEKEPKEITKEEWAKFQDHFEEKSPGASHFNCNKYMTVLVKHLLEKELINKKIMIKDRFARREKNQRRKKKNWVYTQEEIDKLDSACKDLKERVQIRLGYLMGFRIGDVCNLTWERIIVRGPRTFVEFLGSDDKAGTFALCPIPKSLLELILQIPKNSKWVFPQERNTDKHIMTQQINFKDLKHRAGVDRGSFHSMRHFCLSRDFKDPGMAPALIEKVRRVSSQVAKEHYIHVADEDMDLFIKETKK